MNRPLIIGVGNKFRGDDSVGLDVAKMVDNQLSGMVDVSYCEGDPMTLMDLWCGRNCVFLIDAVTSDAKDTGTIHFYDMSREEVPAIFANTSTHFFDVIQVVELARALQKLPEKVFLCGIEASHYVMTQSVSDELKRLFPDISATIVKRIREKLLR